MNIVLSLVGRLSSALRPHVRGVALAIVAALLVVYGNDINRAVKRRFRDRPFVVRTAVFVLLSAFGYGALTVYAAPVLARWLAGLSGAWLAPVVLAAFLALGVLAERKHQI